MRRLSFTFLLLFVSFPALALAQTTVTGTIKDANGNAYANGTASAYLAVVNGQPATSSGPVATNSGGLFTLILTSGSWTFTICAPPINIGPKGNPTPTQVCFSSSPISISGSSQDVSAQLNAIAPLLGPGGGGSSPINTALTPENFGAVGNGSTNDCAAFTTASASAADLYTTSGKVYSIQGNCAVTAQINIVNNCSPASAATFNIAPGATLTLNQPPNTGGAACQIFNNQTTTSVADAMQRSNENPMSDGGKWAACLGSGAGQLSSNVYEGTGTAAVFSVCWANSGAFAANQISTITAQTIATASDVECATVHAATAANTYYGFCISGPFSGSLNVAINRVVTGTQTTIKTCSPPSGVFAGDQLSLSWVSGTLTGYLNGAPIIGCTVSDSNIATGFPGMLVLPNAAIGNATISSWAGATTDTGVVNFNANTTSVLPEWFGAKGDGATDDSVALQACIASTGTVGGECFIAPKTYIANSTLYFTSSLQSLRGAPVGAYGPIIKTNKPSLTQLQIQGASGLNLQYNSVQDITLSRNAQATGNGTGIYVNFVNWTHISRVNSFEAVRGFYFDSNSANTFSDDLIVFNPLGNFASQTGYTYKGAQNSSRQRDAVYIGSGTGLLLSSAVDLFVAGFESSGATIGISLTGSVGDLHIERPINDACSTNCISATSTGFVEIEDSYSAGGGVNVNLLTGATGVHFIGGVVIATGSSPNGFLLQSSSKNNQISGMHITMNGSGNPTGINLSSAPDNTLTDNQILGSLVNVGIQLLTSPNCTVTGNIVSGTGNNGYNITLDSTPSEIANNVSDPTITNSFIGAGVIPTISAGFGTSPSVVAGSQGTRAFTINVGTGGIASTGTIGLPTAKHGWVLNSCTDVTTQSTTVFMCKQTGAGTTTTLPIGNFNTAGAAAAWVASDILTVSVSPY